MVSLLKLCGSIGPSRYISILRRGLDVLVEGCQFQVGWWDPAAFGEA